jgi:hypothetical protein
MSNNGRFSWVNNGWFLWFVFILMVVLAGEFSENKNEEGSRVYRFISERTVNGTVDRISSNRISIRTDEGTTQVFRLGTPGPGFTAKNIAQGDRIVVTFDRNSYQVIDMDKTNEGGLVKHPVFISNPPDSQIEFTQTSAGKTLNTFISGNGK